MMLRRHRVIGASGSRLKISCILILRPVNRRTAPRILSIVFRRTSRPPRILVIVCREIFASASTWTDVRPFASRKACSGVVFVAAFDGRRPGFFRAGLLTQRCLLLSCDVRDVIHMLTSQSNLIHCQKEGEPTSCCRLRKKVFAFWDR